MREERGTAGVRVDEYPARAVKTCQNLPNFRGKNEENFGEIAKSHGAGGMTGTTVRMRKTARKSKKEKGAREPARYEVSRTDRNEGRSGREMPPSECQAKRGSAGANAVPNGIGSDHFSDSL